MRRTRYIELPEDFRPGPAWTHGGYEVLVDCTPYTATLERDWRWCEFTRVAPGMASVYPVKAKVPGRGEGQWKFEEVKRWRVERHILETRYELHRDIGAELPPGIDADWLARALDKPPIPTPGGP